MEIIKYSTHEDMSKAVAKIIAEKVKDNPNAVLCLPTGGTSVTMYEELIRLHREEDIDFSGVTTFKLDEYFGLDENDPQSYRYFMKKHLFSHINIPEEHIHHIHSIISTFQAMIWKMLNIIAMSTKHKLMKRAESTS